MSTYPETITASYPDATTSRVLAADLAREIAHAFRVVETLVAPPAPRVDACSRCAAIDRRIDANIREGMGDANYELAAMRRDCERSHA